MNTLVCGVGGITGNTVLSVLAGNGRRVRALVHRQERVRDALDLGAHDAVIADYADDGALDKALAGVSSVFFVAPSYRTEEPRWVDSVVRAGARAGVQRFVYQSVLHPYTPAMPHHVRKAESEVVVRASDLPWVILQPTMYVQTVLRMRQRSVAGEVNVPYTPEARLATIDVVDIAACVAAVLSDDAYLFGGYELVGAPAASVREMAATMNRVLGEERRVVEVDPADVPLPPAWGERQRAEYALMCREYGAHGLLGSTDTTSRILGREPVSFADVVARDVREGLDL